MIPAGKDCFMLIIGLHMAVIKEDCMLLLRKDREHRQLRQYGQQLLPGKLSAVLLVQMDLRCGDVVPLQHGTDGITLLPHQMDELLPLRLRFQIGAEGVESRQGVVLGEIDAPHGFHGALRIALRQVLSGEHHAAAVDLLLQIRLEELSRIGVEVLRADMDQIVGLVLRLHLCPLVHKAVDVLSQTLPLRMGLWLRQVLDGQRVVQEEAEAEHLAVDQIVHILTAGHKRVEGNTFKKLTMQDHGPAEGKGRALEPRSAADDLIESTRLAAEAVPVGHPRLRRHIVVILPLAVKVVAGNTVNDVAVDSSAQELQRTRDEVRQLKHLVIVNEQRGVRRQDGCRQQADVAHIGVSEQGQELSALAAQACSVQKSGYLPQVSCCEQVGLRIQPRPAHDAEHLLIGFLLHLRRGGADQDHQLEVLFPELLHTD